MKKVISNKEEFLKTSANFMKIVFESILVNKQGEIEIRTFNNHRSQQFFSSVNDAVISGYELCNSQIDVYFGVNPRTGRGGKKENVHFVTAFHAEVDYGQDGHKKNSIHENYEKALAAINNFSPKPTMVNHSGGGFHCYWVLESPLNVKDTGLQKVESINRNLSEALGGDRGTQDISRVLRIPGTYNFKLPDNPRLVEAVYLDGPKYQLSNFRKFTEKENAPPVQAQIPKPITAMDDIPDLNPNTDIDKLPVSNKIKSLILTGNDGSYPSRSEADMSVITSLVNRGVTENVIKEIYSRYPIGEKYRQHSSPETYLKHTIDSAKKFSDLTETELQNPLFLNGSLYKEKGRYHLAIVKFQEYIFRKHKLIILETEKKVFKYNDKCYEECSEELINNICQDELKGYRGFFSKQALSDLIHYAIGDVLINSDLAKKNQVRYLTLQNGLYDLNEGILTDHSPKIFTTNLLPYDYDPYAYCPRFKQYLNEVFLNDEGKINFTQEAVGYAFHKSIPMPTLFFLIGEGSNGKSVFINTLVNLFGEKNTCNISLKSLGNEYYILSLFGKMLNISSETPNKKQIDTDLIKAAVAGDWVTGREPYKPPTKFRPYAKHYLAMNEPPVIVDNTHGMWRRIYPLEFPRVFSEAEMDTNLPDKLLKELPGIFNWALEGYKRLRAKDFKFQDSESMRIAKKKYRSEADSVLSFIGEKLTKGTESDKLKLSEVYEIYKLFCKTEEFKYPVKKMDFKKALIKERYIIDNSTKDQNQVFIFEAKLYIDSD